VELLKEAANKQLQQQHARRDSSGLGEKHATNLVQQQQQQQQQSEHQTHPPSLLSIQLDWWLWHEGEKMRAQHPPHHRTWTVYY
jgi:hypothetical protein